MEKNFLTSKTIWGAIIMTAYPIAKKYGYEMGDIEPWVDAIVTLMSSALVVWGRITATTKVKLV